MDETAAPTGQHTGTPTRRPPSLLGKSRRSSPGRAGREQGAPGAASHPGLPTSLCFSSWCRPNQSWFLFVLNRDVCVCVFLSFNTTFQRLKHVTSELQFRPFSLFHPLKGRVKPQPCPSVRRARGRENTRHGVKIRAVTFRPGLSAGPGPAAPVRGPGRGVSPQAPRPGWPCTCPQGPVPPGEKEMSKGG